MTMQQAVTLGTQYCKCRPWVWSYVRWTFLESMGTAVMSSSSKRQRLCYRGFLLPSPHGLYSISGLEKENIWFVTWD